MPGLLDRLTALAGELGRAARGRRRSSSSPEPLPVLVRAGWHTLREAGVREFTRGLVRTARRFWSRAATGRRFGRQHGAVAHLRLPLTRRVAIVIPTFGPPDETIRAVRSIQRTVDLDLVRVIVTDDGSPAECRARLRAELTGVELILEEENVGFARNANRGLRATATEDVVLLNSDVLALPGWLEPLQHAAHASDDIGVVGPKLLYPDRTIQSAGTHRNLGAPEWFDHRYRFMPFDHGPANVPGPALAMTGACIYIKRSTIDRIGLLDEGYRMAYEDVDYCLRAWQAGLRVMYEPLSTLTHLESKSRGAKQGDRELASQRYFWEKWGDWFDRRRVRAADGRLRVIYVTQDSGVGGGHRVIYEHLNGLLARGHHCELYTLQGPPDWFDLHAPVRVFDTYAALSQELAQQEAIKVATWWETAEPVWSGSVLKGVPAYCVQDIETSYYPSAEWAQHQVLASYRQEFTFTTTSEWIRDRLAELGVDPTIINPGIDLDTYRPLGLERRQDVLLSLGRSQPLKNFDLTLRAWRSISDGRPELWLYGVEPELAPKKDARYVVAPTDEEVNELLNTATALITTSRHEGFCLPLLEAMAAGTPVVCTDAHGNRDFCRHEQNCLMVAAEPDAVRGAVVRILGDARLRERLSEEGLRTAESFRWTLQIDRLERHLEEIAAMPDLRPSIPIGP